MQKRIWQLHSWLGLIAGLGLLLIGITGSLLIFRDQLDALLAPKLTKVEPTASGRLSWSQLLTAAQKAWPEYEIMGFGPRRDPHLADLVYMVKRGDHEYRGATLNPYTGERLSDPMNQNETFTGLLLELHYTWFMNHYGMLITGILATLLCLLGVSGVWLYRDFWKNFFRLRWGRSSRIFFSDAHKMVGITTVVFNLILGFTGAYWNVTHVATEGLAEHEDRNVVKGRLYADSISLDALAVEAARAVPGFVPGWVSLANPQESTITYWGRIVPGHLLTGPFGCSVVFDAQTGALTAANDLRTAGTWAQVVDTFTPLHYGTFGGWAVKILWCLGGLAPGILSVSGFLIWRSRRKRSSASAPPEVALAVR